MEREANHLSWAEVMLKGILGRSCFQNPETHSLLNSTDAECSAVRIQWLIFCSTKNRLSSSGWEETKYSDSQALKLSRSGGKVFVMPWDVSCIELLHCWWHCSVNVTLQIGSGGKWIASLRAHFVDVRTTVQEEKHFGRSLPLGGSSAVFYEGLYRLALLSDRLFQVQFLYLHRSFVRIICSRGAGDTLQAQRPGAACSTYSRDLESSLDALSPLQKS